MLFKYKEKIIVTSGFYEGQKGYIKEVGGLFSTKYKIQFHDNDLYNDWVKEKDIHSLDFPNKRFSNKLNKIIE